MRSKKNTRISSNLTYVFIFLFFLIFTTISLFIIGKNTGYLSFKSKASMFIGDIDPLTGEFYDLQIDAYPIKTITQASAGPLYVTELNLQIHGSRVNTTNHLYGYNQKPYLPYEKEKINFYFKEFEFPRFKSESIILADSGCIDLYRSQNQDKNNYIGTFCYRNTYLQPGIGAKKAYSPTTNMAVEFIYNEKDVGTLVSFTTAFSKYNLGEPYSGVNLLGTRVNYFTIDAGSSLNSFTNVVYYLSGLFSNLSLFDEASLCTISDQYPNKYMKQTWGPKPEGGNNYLLTEKSGYCDYVHRMSYLKPAFISLYMDGGLPFPTPSPISTISQPTIVPTKTRLPPMKKPIKKVTLIPGYSR